MVLNRNRQVPAEDSPAFGAIAERFRRAGDLERAVSLCQEGLQRFPHHVSARVTLGWAFLDLGRFDEARAELEKALKRAPDNLAAIRGLAELHDRSEHDEVAAMHRSGVKWMAEAAAAEPQPPAEATPVAPPTMPQASLAAADPLAAPADETLHEIHDSLEALKAFSSGAFAAPTTAAAEPAVEMPAASSFASPAAPVPTPAVATPARPAKAAAPAPAPSFAAPDPLAASGWAPVEIETAAARVLSDAPVAKVDVTPVQLTSAMDMIAEATPYVAPPAPVVAAPSVAAPSFDESEFDRPTPAMGSLDEFDAPMPVPTTAAAPAESFSSFESLDDLGLDDAFDPPVVAATEPVQPIVLTPVIDMPEEIAVEAFDPDLPALAGEWSEMGSDAYVLPAAVEAARATADEGPGPWPPVIEDDPVESPVAAMAAAPVAEFVPAASRKPNVNALNRFLRRVETRRASVMAQYLAG
jgi:hypothetical protein